MKIKSRFLKLVMAVAVAANVLAVTSVPTFAAAKHTVTFLYGTKCYKTTVEDGCTVLPPTDTYVPGYIFTGWVGSSVNVKSDLTILGSYAPVVQTPVVQAPVAQTTVQNYSPSTYQIVVKDGLTGAEFYHQTVSAGADASVPDNIPHHDGYHFDHFEGSFTNVNGNRTIIAIYDRDYNDYDWNEDYEDLLVDLWLAEYYGLI